VTWSLVLAVLWVALLVPVGHVLGRALRQADDRDSTRAPVDATPPTPVPTPLDPPSAPVPDAFSRHA
jgi:hypothetical protein